MAHALAVQMVKQEDMAIDLASCGIRAQAGAATTAEAIIILAQQDINWQGTSQPLSAEDLMWADHVWVMTEEHLQFVQALAANNPPQTLPQIELLAGGDEVLDPLGLGLEIYQSLYFELVDLLPKRLAALSAPSVA